MTEASLVNKIMASLEKGLGGIWIKISAGPFQVAGLPDIIGCYKGKFIGLEVKLPGKEKTLTKIQQFWLRKINEAGGKASMVTSVEQSLELVQNTRKRLKISRKT